MMFQVITTNLLRRHSSLLLCSRKLLHNEIVVSSTIINRVSETRFCASKKLFSTTHNVHIEKPVILSASEIVQDASSSVSAVADTVTQSTFAELGLAQTWWPSHLVESLFESIYVHTGSPWWLSIALGTLVLRIVTAPLFVFSRKSMIRYTNHAAGMSRLRQEMSETYQSGKVEEQTKARKRYKEYMKEHKTSPFRLMLGNIALPVVFISCMRALNEMTSLPVPALATSSFYWISNLLEPDPYRILPLVSGCMVGVNMFIVMRLNPAVKMKASTTAILSLIPVVLMPLVFGNWSSAFGVYLFVNSAFTSAISSALATKKVQVWLNMPEPNLKKGKDSPFMQSVLQNRNRMIRKQESKEIRRMLKEEKKNRKKELKGDPPRLFEIGTEARLKKPVVLDFESDWRPPKVNIYDR